MTKLAQHMGVAGVNRLRETEAVEAPRFHRLGLIDRHSAETLSEFCRVNTELDSTASHLANLAAIQSLLTSIPLIVADFFSLFVSLFGSSALLERLFSVETTQVERLSAFLIALIIIPISHLAGLYPGLGMGSAVEFRQLTRALACSLVVFAGIGLFCFPPLWGFYSASAALAFVVGLPTAMTVRFVARRLAKYIPWWGAPVFIVAEPARGIELYWRMKSTLDQGFRPLGVLINPEDYWDNTDLFKDSSVPVYDIRRADEEARRMGVAWVIVSPCAGQHVTQWLNRSLAAIPNRIMLSSSQMDLGLWDDLFCISHSSGIRVGGARPSLLQLAVKRGLDILLTLCILIMGSAALALLCFLMRVSSRGPIFYGQKRVGRYGREFTAWKFRTMVMNADQVLDDYLARNPAAKAEWDHKHKLSDDPRVTMIGKFLRATSLDELPQLWNVLHGDMSLVGPRPVIDSPTYDAVYIYDYPDEFEAYKTVRPGLTGLWQVSSRSRGVYELRIYWDMYYIRNWSVWLDLYLIMRTIKTVLFKEGAH